MQNPFGTKVTSDEIIENLSFFDEWEDRYRYIIDLGKQLPKMTEAQKTPENLLRGCQSQVWLTFRLESDQLLFDVDSDAVIVRGLLAMVLCAYNHKTSEQILKFDIESYFHQTDLLKHLSPTRGNGLRSMVERIKNIAQAQLSMS